MRLTTVELARAVPGADGPRWLYRELDLSFKECSLSAVIGPNGAGKSTLLRDLAGLRALAGGSVCLEGQVLTSYPAAARARRIAYLPQRTTLEHDMSAFEVVLLGRAPHVGRFAAPAPRDRERAAEALAQVGLEREASRGVQTLSGGEFQRVMLARMLASEAEILILDEPTAALDIGHALAFLELCRGLAGAGRTLIVAMHALELARRYADQVVLLTGAGDGGAHVGATASVLTPALLEPVFGVTVRALEDGQLRFELPARRA